MASKANTMRIPLALGAVILMAVALQMSCKKMMGVGEGTPCVISTHNLTIAVSGGALTVSGGNGSSSGDVNACPGDTINWARASGTDTNVYTVQFDSSTADPCGWSGVQQNVPVSCSISTNASKTNPPGDKYSLGCSSGPTCTNVPVMDPHIVIMGR